MTAIVTVNVTQTIAPTPSELQKTGAFISQGGTTTTAGTKTLLTRESDLDEIVRAPAAVTSLTFSGNVVTAVTTAPHGLPVGDVIQLTISDSVGTSIADGYNGTFMCTITSTTGFTYALPGSTPGGTPAGMWSTTSAVELEAMANTFFAQGSQQGVYVLELGIGNVSQGVDFLEAWIEDNPGEFYSYLVPRIWDVNPTFLAFLAGFEATTAKTYFFVTTTLATYQQYDATQKCLMLMVESPTYDKWSANIITNLVYSGAWGANVCTAASWAATDGGQVTYTTTTAHGVLPGQQFVISGFTPSGYNGTFIALPGTEDDTLIAALTTDPGADSVQGTLVASTGGTVTATTTSAHGIEPGDYFKITGVVSSISGGYNGTHLAQRGTTGSTIVFNVATNPGTDSFPGQIVASLYANAGVPATEFSLAGPFWVTLNYRPSTTNKVTPTAYSYLYGVTPFPTQGNSATLQLLQDAAINVVGTGAEGGVSTAILSDGTTRDERDFTYWYSVDWVQITVARNLANAIINGSNNPINPLYYNQDGINRLQQVVVNTMNSGLTFGLVLGAVKQVTMDGPAFTAALNAGDFDGFTVVNAVPFVPYSQANPSHYAIGQYDGLSVVYIPARGFKHIVFNVNVTDFVAT